MAKMGIGEFNELLTEAFEAEELLDVDMNPNFEDEDAKEIKDEGEWRPEKRNGCIGFKWVGASVQRSYDPIATFQTATSLKTSHISC